MPNPFQAGQGPGDRKIDATFDQLRDGRIVLDGHCLCGAGAIRGAIRGSCHLPRRLEAAGEGDEHLGEPSHEHQRFLPRRGGRERGVREGPRDQWVDRFQLFEDALILAEIPPSGFNRIRGRQRRIEDRPRNVRSAVINSRWKSRICCADSFGSAVAICLPAATPPVAPGPRAGRRREGPRQFPARVASVAWRQRPVASGSHACVPEAGARDVPPYPTPAVQAPSIDAVSWNSPVRIDPP